MTSLAAVAHHEAGHAVAAWRVGADIESVSAALDGGLIVTRGPTGLPWRVFLDKKLLLIFAGPEAQRLFYPESDIEYGAFHDYASADKYLSVGFGSDVATIAAVQERARAEARAFVRRERPIIAALAAELVRHGHLDGIPALRIMRQAGAANGFAIGS